MYVVLCKRASFSEPKLSRRTDVLFPRRCNLHKSLPAIYTREVPMKLACVHVLLAKCWSCQTGLCQGMKHISRTTDNYFVVPHKPNILSTGFQTFAVIIKAAEKPCMSSSYFYFAPSVNLFCVQFIHAYITNREKSWVEDKKVKFWENYEPHPFFVLSRWEVIFVGSISTSLAAVSVYIIFSCLHHSEATFLGHKPLSLGLPSYALNKLKFYASKQAVRRIMVAWGRGSR